MRSHRTQKKMLKEATTNIAFAADYTFSKYESYDVAEDDTTNYTKLETYEKPTDMTAVATGASIKAVSNFSEDLKYYRRKCMKKNENTNFTVSLVYENGEEANRGKSVNISFEYTENTTSGATEPEEHIVIFVEVKDPANPANRLRLETPKLDLDSDITEYLFRFTKGLSWGSVTYGILDCNPNESVNKGIYLTMNAPFNGCIGWGDEVRKLILAYNILAPQ